MKKAQVISFGCQMNSSDSERIASVLKKQGYQITASQKEAGLVVINCCSVRQSAVDKIKNQIATIKNANKKARIILTGCLLKTDRDKFKQIGCETKSFRGLANIKPFSGLIPIGYGCNNFCSYCVVPYTRGREKYRNPKDILCEIKYLLKKGIKDITLIAQNVNSYKYGKTDFADLLKIVNDIKGDFKIRFLTNHPKDMSEKLIEIIAELPKVKKEIHLPFQAGSNIILKKMNRHYTKQNYLKLVEKIRKKIPGVILTTDVIVGFPGETKKQFQETAAIAKKVGFKQIFIGKYSPRPGTAAYKMKDNVPLIEKKRREQILLHLIKNEK